MNHFLKIFMLLLPLISFSEAVFAEHISGTKVELEPPPGFAPSAQFTGYEYQGDYNASIVVIEMPAPVSEILKGLTAERMAQSGITLLDSSKIKVDNVDSSLLHVSQSSGSQIYMKWILVAGDDKHTTMINGIFPQEQTALLDAPIKRAILSAKWNADTPQDVFEGLKFRVQPTATLKVTGRIVNYIMLTESGQQANADPNKSMCIVGDNEDSVSLSIDQIAEFSRRRLLAMRSIQDIFGDFSEAGDRFIKIDGVESYERLVSGVRRKNGEPSQIYQVVIPYPAHFDEIICYGPISRMPELLSQFRLVAESFKRIP